MQALLAPVLAAGGAAATTATTATLALQAGSAILGGVASAQQASAQKEQAKINSYIGRTRAIQTDVSARQGLESELGTMRAALAANGQRQNVGTAEVFKELKSTRARERRIEFGNQMQTAADYSAEARAINPSMSIIGGALKAGPSLFDLYELKRRR